MAPWLVGSSYLTRPHLSECVTIIEATVLHHVPDTVAVPDVIQRIGVEYYQVGELTWQLPMYDEYREQLKSDIADIKNVGGRYAGAITAAKFLAEFIDGTPWVHLDIAGTADTDKEKGYQVKGATGVPVRTLVNLILSMAEKSK